MKKLILIILPFLFIGCATTLPPAGPSTKMMKKANTIILKVDQTPKEAYKKFYRFLSDHNFGFRNTDKDLMLLKTDYRDFGNAASSYKFSINASIRADSTTEIVISGNGNMGIGKDYDIYKSHHLLDNIGKSWKKMNEIVSAYPHKEILYKRN